MSLLIIGCGYVGQELIRRLRGQSAGIAVWSGQPVSVLTRSQQQADLLRKLGVQPIIGHWLRPESLPTAPKATRVLVSVPHRTDSVAGLPDDSCQHHALGLKNLVSWLSLSRQEPVDLRIIYLSTTGVFGSPQPGELVSESTPVSPTRPGPRLAVAAEDWLCQRRSVLTSIVLRLAGIYGPGRVPLIESLKSGQPLAVPRAGTLNLIHVQDAARAIEWLLMAQKPQATYLLSDCHPVERQEFYGFIAQQSGLGEPQFVEPVEGNSRLRRATDKRVDSSLFWLESGLQPLYPDYRSGLKAIL